MVRPIWRDGISVGRHRVRRLLRLIGLEAIYQSSSTGMPHPAHRVYPYLLTAIAIERPNQVRCVDTTSVPVERGFLYLVAIINRILAP